MKDTMKALMYMGVGQMELQEIHMPTEDFIVRVIGSGVCGTDVKTFLKGHHFFEPPTVLGHECYGEVVRCAPETGYKPGDFVSVAPYCECGECDVCRRGAGQLCNNKSYVPYGAFQEYIGIPADYVSQGVFKIGEAADVYALVEPLACVLNGLEHLRLRKESRALVVGSGPMGTLFALVFGQMGVPVDVVEPAPNRVAFLQGLGITVHQPGEADYKQYDNIVVAVNKGELVDECVKGVADAGTVLSFSGLPKGTALSTDSYAIHYREVSLTGSFGYGIAHYKKALQMIEDDPKRYDALITHRLPLEQGLEGFEMLRKAEPVKLMFKFDKPE